jgi:predicted transcriptional regulator of viral defense system
MKTLVSSFIKFCLLLFAALAIHPSVSNAVAIQGLIDTADGKLTLVTKYDIAYVLDSPNPDVKSDLERLRQGDYLAARGNVDELNHLITVEAIESLGLRELLGAWSSSRLEVYEFQDFTRLNLYVPNSTRNKVEIAGKYNYAVAPDHGDRYSIFLSDNRSVLVGTLEFKNQRLQLTVLDPKTGRVSQNISLSPLTLK